jgi:hypothetical protein
MKSILKGKIYKVFHKDFPDIIYIGSTIKSLEERYPIENDIVKRGYCSRPICYFFDDYGWEGFTVELLQNYNCYNRQQLLFVEQYRIDKLKPELNTNRAYTKDFAPDII